MNSKINGLLNLARKAGALVIGSDNLENHRQKLYLILTDSSSSESTKSVAEKVSKKTGASIKELNDMRLSEILSIEKCQIVGLKNKGFAIQIEKIIY